MRRKDKEITDINEKIAIIEKCKYCRLGLSENNYPYIVPMNYGYVYENEKLTLFFHGAKEGKKIGILNNKKIIDVILSSVEVGYRKPNINGYIILSKKLEVQTNEMIYIGNEEKDIIGANKAGIISILINRKDEEINYGEKYQFKNLLDMWHFIKNL